MPPETIDSLDAPSLRPLVFQLLSRIDELIRRNGALTDEIKALLAQIAGLNARIAELEAASAKPPKTPDNSSLPPSRGQKSNGSATPERKPRKGRPGVARQLAENPDATRDIHADRCRCGAALGPDAQQLARAFDHIDLPPIKPVTTRINLYRATCPCCCGTTTATPPADMPEGSPFGPGIVAVIAYLHGRHMVSYERLVELCDGLLGLDISEGAIANMLRRAGKPLAAAADSIAATVRASDVVASDETSARVAKKTWWQWTFGCATAVYHVIAPSRGKCVPTEFLAGVKPKVWLSDRYAGQGRLAEAHQLCLAHLGRDAQYAIDHGDCVFAPAFKAFLKDACAVGRARPDLDDATIDAHRQRLEKELDRILELETADSAGRHLRDAMFVDARDKLLVFLTRRDVEPTNNESERSLRPSVIFRKVTNCFRSTWGAKVYADFCSIVGTGRLNGRSPLEAIRTALVPA